MPDPQEKRKDIWDKLSAVTPLLLGLAVTGVGALFTQVYNFRQLQINQITALEKLRPLLTSEKPEEREFGYASFVALGYEAIAVSIIQIKKDESGRPVLVELKNAAASPEVKATASNALQSLDEAKRLVNKLEYGDARGLDAWMEKGDQFAGELGLKTKLGRALMASEVIARGLPRTKKMAETTSQDLGGSPLSGMDEKRWVAHYLEVMAANPGPIPQAINRRVSEFKGLVERNDWDLKTEQPVSP